MSNLLLELSPSSNPFHPTTDIDPKDSLPDKFDKMRARFRGLIKHIKLIIRLQPQRYTNNFRQVGPLGTVLLGDAQAWFAPLVETSLALL